VLITVAILVVPYAIWWAVDRNRTASAAGAPAALVTAGPAPVPLRAHPPMRPRTPAPTRMATPTLPPTRMVAPSPVPSSGRYTPAPVSGTAVRHRVSTLPAEVTVTVTREEDHQDALATRHLASASTPTRVTAELASGIVGKGKHRGAYAIEVRLAGLRVGELTAAMSERYGDLVRAAEARGDLARAEGLVSWGDRGFQIALRLPRP
jgi:hypothetical protein